jgi:hypothetical protein
LDWFRNFLDVAVPVVTLLAVGGTVVLGASKTMRALARSALGLPAVVVDEDSGDRSTPKIADADKQDEIIAKLDELLRLVRPPTVEEAEAARELLRRGVAAGVVAYDEPEETD